MKQLGTTLLAGIAGGLITLAGIFWLQPMTDAVSTPNEVPARLVNLSPGGATVAAPTFDFREAARLATPAVVHIKALVTGKDRNPFQSFLEENSPFSPPPSGGSGSGVIYSTDGYIVTNNHVIDGADQLEVILFDNRTFVAEIVGRDTKSDIAVLKIDANDLPTLALADSDEAEIGEWVLAVGNPLDLTSTVTAGIISAKGRSLELLPGRDAIEAFIQTDAAVNPGNSGGALVDAEGRLLGINTAIATRTGLFQGYSFAIPVNLVARIVDDIIRYGEYQRAFLGVSIYPLDAEVAQELGVSLNQGVVIDELVDGGSAQYAGLLPQDIIIAVNSRAIRDVPELTEIVGRSKVGDVLDITVWRNGQEVELPVRMRPQKN
ncbi:MAG: trypsin-like peptidase domain-containing protein [Lewinella sp.]|nr:trypsin-like peptidase domain-containing protein [Lewinella sp.]